MKAIRFLLKIGNRPAEGRLRMFARLCDLIRPDLIEDGYWLSETTPITSLGGTGKLIGHIFSSDTYQPPDLSHDRIGNSVAPMFECLVTHHWGAYFAFGFDASTYRWSVMADPSGLLPVFVRRSAAHTLISNDPSLLEVGGKKPRVSWGNLSAYLQQPELRQRRTCLEAIEELRPGAIVWLDGATNADHPLWQPDPFVASAKPTEFREAAYELRRRIVGVMGGWAKVLPPPAVAVSGGVDSSVICAALSAGARDFGCVTMATSDRSGDERTYARNIAAHFGKDLAEQVYRPESFDPFVSASIGQARPNRRLFTTAFDQMLSEGANAIGRQPVFDGNGGDNLFCFLHSAAPVIDRVLVEKSLRGAAQTLIDMCHVTGCDISDLVKASARRVKRGVTRSWPRDQSMLSAKYMDSEHFDPLTPWLNTDVGFQRGKLDHLALVMHAQNHLHGFAPGPERFSPLMSQPIFEYCLQVPTWLWPRGGLNRALARQAFAHELPDWISRRTSKAGPDSFVRQIYRLHRDSIGEILLDGLLVSNDVLDRQQLEDALAIDPEDRGPVIYRLLDLVEAENWARSWSG